MCNLYALTKGQQALRDLARALELGPESDRLGNLASLPGIYPDGEAPIIRMGKADAETPGPVLQYARWGMPSPAFALDGKTVDRGITNIRNTASPHWRRWLSPPHRCLVPFTAFAEHVKGNAGFVPLWFEKAAQDPLACFAGIATRWTGVRRRAEGAVTLTLFGFLTCEPNEDVAPHHPKAMPVILTAPSQQRHWLTANWAEAATLQRPLADGTLRMGA
ncbi:SOS response-associated peptidase family protein [Sandarakinorhabdus sp.]|uniref:SOS response-associated peptidase n=1 Tax=Sandarakinorhabdus sp. TaxID=1916663 RepID=UPI003341801E